MDCFVYILSGCYRGTLYIGVTSNLVQRVYQHQNHLIEGFTTQYTLDRLVWFEGTASIEAAIMREKQMKEWKRAWKIRLVEEMNPTWRDLYPDLLG
ncbi:MAG TPA: GIY-YIG nuclease family protein [Ramlibacter sp.]